jgi:hypothetical protein
MTSKNLNSATLPGRTPSVSASPRQEQTTLLDILVSIVLSLIYRRERPPDVPAHLRADLGLDVVYEPKTWFDLDQRIRSKRPDHE